MTEWLLIDHQAKTVTIVRHPNGYHCYYALKFWEKKGYTIERNIPH